MARAFAKLAFTPSVRAQQARMGSARAYAKFLDGAETEGDRLGPEEAAFIAARDGVYQASVSAEGWPYVQFRGGPAGFLKVLDARTVAYADYRGNRQYISAGNLAENDRVGLILMDYPNRRRLKLWGRARLLESAEAPDVLESLRSPGDKAPAERAVVIEIAALDWNCPRHIPQRFTLDELEPHLAPLRAEMEALRAENRALRRGAE